MARKPKSASTPPEPKATTPDIPGIAGPGIAPLSVPEIDKAIARYERAKEKRCAESPKEIAAKGELLAALHANRSILPVNSDGNAFYRYDGTDYLLEETLKRRKVGDDGSEE